MDELWCECDILREDDVLQFPEFRPQNIFMVQIAANCISEDISLLINGKHHYCAVILENTKTDRQHLRFCLVRWSSC